VHAALAEALQTEDPDRFAWHLAAAATGPDEPASAALEAAAVSARARSGHAAAAAAFERAAALTPTAREKARRLFLAAQATYAGPPKRDEMARTLALLTPALERQAEPEIRYRIRFLRSRYVYASVDPWESVRMLMDDAREAEPVDPCRSALLATTAVLDAARTRADADALAASEHAARLAYATSGFDHVFIDGCRGIALLLNGRASDAQPLLLRGLELVEQVKREVAKSGNTQTLLDRQVVVLETMVALGRFADARDFAESIIRDSRAVGAESLVQHRSRSA
jgi:hypothetical protein